MFTLKIFTQKIFTQKMFTPKIFTPKISPTKIFTQKIFTQIFFNIILKSSIVRVSFAHLRRAQLYESLVLLFCFHYFFHEALGILYIVLKNRQNFVEKNTESVMSSSPLDLAPDIRPPQSPCGAVIFLQNSWEHPTQSC